MIDEKTNLYIDETRDYLLESVSHLLRLYLRSAGTLQIDNPKVISTTNGIRQRQDCCFARKHY